MEWFGLKVREVRDTQWKHFFYMGNVLQRAPEFMKGGEEYEIPRATSEWGAHVYMDASQIMMGCQKLMEEGKTSGEDEDSGEEKTVVQPWHIDGAPVTEDGETKHLAEAETMKNLMHGMSFMVPIQDERQLKTKSTDGREVTNKWQVGDLAMWGHTVKHAGLLLPASHKKSLNSVWTVDLRSKKQTEARSEEELLVDFIPEKRIKEDNPLMSPWGDDALIAYADEAGAFAATKLQKAGQEVERRGKDGVKKAFLESMAESIEELQRMKGEYEKKFKEDGGKKKADPKEDDDEEAEESEDSGDEEDSEYEEGEEEAEKGKETRKRKRSGGSRGKVS